MVKLIERKGNVLKVKGLDAIDEAPLINIKSFSQNFIPDAKIEWLKKLERLKKNVNRTFSEALCFSEMLTYILLYG